MLDCGDVGGLSVFVRRVVCRPGDAGVASAACSVICKVGGGMDVSHRDECTDGVAWVLCRRGARVWTEWGREAGVESAALSGH